VPFLQLDGYFMVSHALGLQYLRAESYRYWWQRFAAVVRRPNGPSETRPGYRRRDAWTYSVYGVVSLLFDVTAAVWLAVVVFVVLRRLAGPVGAGGVLLLGVGAVVAVRLLRMRSTARKPS
jgi:putative peptide zinc metalloprotease protein